MEESSPQSFFVCKIHGTFCIDALSIVFFSSGLMFGIGSFSTLNAKFMARCIDVFSMMVAMI